MSTRVSVDEDVVTVVTDGEVVAVFEDDDAEPKVYPKVSKAKIEAVYATVVALCAETGYTDELNKKIAEEVGCSERSVQYALVQLWETDRVGALQYHPTKTRHVARRLTLGV
jgi:5-deoxy-D-glucuronate isomerase